MTFTSNQTLVTVAVLIGLGAFGTPAHAKVTAAQKCTAAKLKAAAKEVDAKLKCHAKTNLAAAPDPTCLQKAEAKFDKAFAKAESPGACAVNGDAAATEASIDSFVDALVQALQPLAARVKATPAQKCAVAKLQAASKNAGAKTQCHIKDLSLASVSLLNFCLSTAEDKFETAFAKAEVPGSCATAGDAAAIETMVAVLVSALAAGPPTPTPTRTPTLLPGQPTPTPPPGSRFHDNGNGTITDQQTGLMWEKKDRSSDGVHDMSLVMPWAGTCSVGGALCQQSTPTNPSGLCFAEAAGGPEGCALCSAGTCNTTGPGVVTAWGLAAYLNVVNFAGHNDWRLPTVAELQTIMASPCPGDGQPCVPAAFNSNCTNGCTGTTCSCTVLDVYSGAEYWSANTHVGYSSETPVPSEDAWIWNFVARGGAGADFKYRVNYVRAVRGGAPASAVCGDGTCNGTETCQVGGQAPTAGNCVYDCGECLPVCGDGSCNGSETCGSCPSDCGPCGPVCGNGTCEAGEACVAPQCNVSGSANGCCCADCGCSYGCPSACQGGGPALATKFCTIL